MAPDLAYAEAHYVESLPYRYKSVARVGRLGSWANLVGRFGGWRGFVGEDGEFEAIPKRFGRIPPWVFKVGLSANVQIGD